MKITGPDAGAAMFLRSAAELDKAKDGKESKEAEGARGFDSYFLAQILKSAHAEGEEHLLDGGSAGRMYRDFFMEEIAKAVVVQGGFGIAEHVGEKAATSSGEPDGERKGDS